MTTRWEYAVLAFAYDLKDEAWIGKWYVWWPGKTVADERSSDVFLTAMLNELGAQGWELTSSYVHSSAVVPGHGLQEIGTPVEMRWLFKRAA
jgi:hypothetical protein